MKIEKIGGCTLALGDARGFLDWSRQGFDAVVTDPPYGMSYRSGRRKEAHKKIRGDDGGELLSWACSLTPPHSAYVFCRWENIADIPRPKSVITWVKNNHTAGDLKHSHARKTELIAFYPGPGHWFPEGRPKDVVEFARETTKDHPTPKPVPLMTEVVGWTAGTVFDPFMGGGSTGVACALAGREFIGCEIDPDYFDLSARRIRSAYGLT